MKVGFWFSISTDDHSEELTAGQMGRMAARPGATLEVGEGAGPQLRESVV